VKRVDAAAGPFGVLSLTFLPAGYAAFNTSGVPPALDQ
jgi:hypothetical protein